MKIGADPEAAAAVAPAATADRVDKAIALFDRAVQLADAQHDHMSYQKAWTMVSKCAGPALEYDLRLLPPAAMAAPTAKLAAALRRTLQHLLAEPLTDQQWEQVALPTTYGGLGLRAASPAMHATASYWCSAAAEATIVPWLAADLGMP